MKYVTSFENFDENSFIDESIKYMGEIIDNDEHLEEGILDSDAYNGWKQAKSEPAGLAGVANLLTNPKFSDKLDPKLKAKLKEGMDQLIKETGIDFFKAAEDRQSTIAKKLLAISNPNDSSSVGKEIKDKITYTKGDSPKNSVYVAVYYAMLPKKGYSNVQSGGKAGVTTGFDINNIVAYAEKGKIS